MSNRDDHLIQMMDPDAGVRVLAAVTTQLADEARRRHGTTPTSSAALGRTLTGTLLLARTLKELDRLTIQVRGNGPIGGITAEATKRGTVRGYVVNPEAEAPINSRGKLDVKAIVGEGTFHAIHESGFDVGLAREPYYASVPIDSGEIAEDFAYYLAISEQINSVVALGVYVEPEESRVTASGGYIVQALPGTDEAVVAQLEAMVAEAPAVTSMILAGASAADMMGASFGGLNWTVLEEMPVEFKCTCSYQRAVQIVTALGQAEVRDMLSKDNGAELTCHFCNEVYTLDEAALEQILRPSRVT
ncbi:MAG: Hsp33 family molecular chaperone HslO [Acidobacteriota bacterium]